MIILRLRLWVISIIYLAIFSQAVDGYAQKLEIDRDDQATELVEKGDAGQQPDQIQISAEDRQRNLLLFGLFFMLVLVLGVVYILQRGMSFKHKASLVIGEKNQELERLNDEISLKNEEILMQNESLSMQREMLLRSHEEMEQKHAKLEELYREQSSLMSVVAHDLKSPLDQIKGILQLLPIDGSLTEGQQDSVRKLNSISDNAKKLINNLLLVNRIEDLEEHHSTEAVYIGEFVQQVMSQFDELSYKKSISLALEVADPALSAQIVKDFLSRVLENLLSNAIKFSPAGSRVLVKVHRESDWVMVIVKDEGPGFSAEDQRLMFRKFQTLSARPTGGESSSGLGLFIVHKLVQCLGGRLELTSQSGQGAEFALFIPISVRRGETEFVWSRDSREGGLKL